MLTEVLKELGWLRRPNEHVLEIVHGGIFEISGGILAPSDFLKEGQYFYIVGSSSNDGIHQHPAVDLTDEAFAGAVWAMAVPPAVIALSSEIEEYCEKQKDAGPYVSESFGGYSYTKATGQNGAPLSWQSAFSSRLAEWRIY